MVKTGSHIRFLKILSAVFLVLVLAWLTVSLPFVYEARSGICKITNGAITGSDNPFAGATEEKAPSNTLVSVVEEYLHHDDHDLSIYLLETSNTQLHAQESAYIAFHGELLVPPPNFLS